MLCLSQMLFGCFIQLRMCHYVSLAAINHDDRMKAERSLLSFQIINLIKHMQLFHQPGVWRHRNEPKDQQKQSIKPMATQGEGIVVFILFFFLVDPSLLYTLPRYSFFGTTVALLKSHTLQYNCPMTSHFFCLFS